MKKTRKLTILAMLVSIALVLHVVEGMFPVPFTVPGIKLGLANTVTLISIFLFGWKEVSLIVLLRCILGSLFGGSISGFLFSVSGGLLSAIIMYILYNNFNKYFSLVGTSTLGAIAHNIGQLLVASLIITDFRIYIYLPVLMIASVVTGLFIGVLCNYAKELLLNNINKLGLDLNEK